MCRKGGQNMIFFDSRKPSVVRRRVRISFLVLGLTALGLIMSQVSVLASQGKMRKIDEFVEVTHHIHSYDELNRLASKNMSGHYILMSDIEINGNSPLYDNEKTLNGTIDGNGFNIVFKGNVTHSFIYKISSTGIIKNLGVCYDDNCTYNGLEENFGGIALYNEGTIDNSFVTANITLNNNHLIGGICAYNSGTITNVISRLNINENEQYINKYMIGGVAGTHTKGVIQKSYGEIISSYIVDNLDDIINEKKPNPVEGVFVGSRAIDAVLENDYSIDRHYPYIDRNLSGVNLLEEFEFYENNVFTSDTYGLRFSTSIWNINNGGQLDYSNLLIDNCSVKEGE